MKNIMKLSEKIRDLLSFTPLQYMLAAIEENPKLAKVYVDEEENTCFILLGHYLFVAGNVTNDAVNYLSNEILSKEVRKELGVIIVFYPNDIWKNAISDLFPHKCKSYERSLYRQKPNSIFDDSKCETKISPINNELLDSSFENISMIIDEVIGTNTYNSMDDFIHRGIGFTPIIDNKICGFCTSEYPSKSEIAIGIEVLEDYQKQGIAKAMTKAFLNKALKKDLTVNWECWKNNIPSVNTALSCGFEKVEDYPVIFIELV